jgi:hypothetical protein
MAKNDGINIDLPFQPIRFDVVAFNEFIKSNGIALEHYKAVTCPIGMTDSMDSRSSHSEHTTCQNGYIYKKAGIVTATFTNNSAITSLGDVGLIDGSVVNVTFPQFYDDCPDTHVYVQTYDRFYIKDCAVLVPNTQRVEAHITGVDKFTYLAKKVEYVIDSHGKEYGQEDFTVQDGKLVWTSDNRPGFDAELNKGTIYSIRYLYTPFFYASRIIHEVRIAHRSDFITGEKTAVRVPYAALLSREYYMHKQERSDNPEENGNRTMDGARDSVFGPR